VSIFIGNANTTSSGLKKLFTSPSTTATTMAVGKLATTTPGNRYEVIPTATDIMRTLTIRSMGIKEKK
jgi:hypothetical protein